jgi:5-oxoprolinase (ATP-hydrolysing)/N-methylhydantoinase A
VVELGRGNRPQGYNAFYRRDPVLVPRTLRFEIEERTLASGSIECEPSEEALSRLAEEIRAADVRAVALGFLNSYINPSNEERVADYLRRAFPETYFTTSSSISRQWREFERFTTAAANAYVGPVLDRYLTQIESGLTERGFRGQFALFDSNGGALSLESARRYPVRLLESGPVAGVLAACRLASQLGLDNVVTFDMGGTTAKMSLIKDGERASTNLTWLGGYETGFPIQIPSVDIIEIGAGGGSIAWLDEGGRLRVGPRSSGASPGPACYGLGGQEPTVTDADVYCGHISPAHFVSHIRIDREQAVKAVDRLAAKLGMEPLRLASGILTLADLSMADAVRTKTVSLGLDPRAFVLVASGGAGPLHACGVAAEVGIQKVLIPPFPGHFSAIGMLAANLRFDRREVFNSSLESLDNAALERTMARIRDDLTAVFSEQSQRPGGGLLHFSYGLAMRYRGQEHTLTIRSPFPGMEVPADAGSVFRGHFEEEYLLRFGHQHEGAGVEIVEVEVVAELDVPTKAIAGAPEMGFNEMAVIDAYFGGNNEPVPTRVIPRTILKEDDVFEGPVIIYENGSNTVVPPGATGVVLKGGHLMIDVSRGVAGNIRKPQETSKERLDALDLEIFRHAMTALLDEVEVNLTRTAYSPLVYEYKDYAVGILTPDFELMSQSQMGAPVFVGDLGKPVEDAVKVIGLDNLAPGDAFITNYAAVQGQHLNNVVLAAPVFGEGQIVAYIAMRVHWADVGGIVPGSISWESTEVFQEGVQFRGLKVMRSGQVVPEVIATILANTRMEELVQGDLLAQLGVCVLGCRRWEERIGSKWDAPSIRALWGLQRAQSADYARRRIRSFPNGTYEAECALDDSGKPGTDPLPLKVKVVVEDEKMVIDFTGMPPQVTAPINSGASGGALNLARVGYKMLVAPDFPTDEGLFAPLEVKLKEGSLVSARKGAPLANWNCANPTVIDLILRAIGERVPDLAPAGHHASIGYFLFSGRDKEGHWWQYIETAMGGWGGSVHADGYSPLRTMMHGDNRDIPIEITEARFPLKVLNYGFIPDSAGEGLHRGGFGVDKTIEALDDVYFSAGIDRTSCPPWGLAGGEAGKPGCIEVWLPEEKVWREVRKVSQMSFPRCSMARVRSAGGGGWGLSQNRPEAEREADKSAGLVGRGDHGP